MTQPAAILWAFAIGSVPVGAIVGRVFFRTDLRKRGSGNIGAANALRTLGRGAGATVLVLDALKGFIPTLVALKAGGPTLGLVAGFAAILGHCYSPALKFKGGKGVATGLGVLFALSWQTGLIFMLVWIVAGLGSGYASAGSLVATTLSILPLWYFLGTPGAIYGFAAALFIAWRHRENLQRLIEGRENKLQLPGRSRGASSSASNPGGLP